MEKKASKVVVGGSSRGVLLTTAGIYNVAHGLSAVDLDSSSLDRIARGKPSVAVLNAAELRRRVEVRDQRNSGDGDRRYGSERVRAELVIVLHKLLNGSNCIRAFLPKFIAEVLNLRLEVSFLQPEVEDSLQRIGMLILTAMETQKAANETEWGSGEAREASAAAKANKRFDGGRLTSALEEAGAGELGLTADECAALKHSAYGAVAGYALASHELDSLTVVADAVVALSCEALEADTSPLESPALKQPLLPKSEVEVAADLACLLSGSKLVKARKGGADATFVGDVPAAHGALRDAAKSFAATLRVEINRVPDSSSARLAGDAMSTSACLSHAIGGSLRRIGTITDAMFWLQKQSQSPPALNETVSPSGRADCFIAVEMWMVKLAREGAAALVLLGIKELSSVRSDGNAGVAVGGKPAAKQRKAFVLGKGTDDLRQKFAAHVVGHPFALQSLEDTTEALIALLHPYVPEYEALVAEVKRVLESSNESRRLPKTAKGTRDFKPEQMAIREKAFGMIAMVFKRHGAAALDTPVFELRETLMGKYGEDSKLIYDLADQGGEMLSLRYDLTVPFARYLAMNKVENLKRYHIAKVYRRDNPAKGRYREFYQCDLDIAGRYPLMVPDFEVLKVLTELLDELDIGAYEVKLNHRGLLDGMLDICGVPEAKFRSICSAIDKLDKLPWEKVREEMVEEKGLTPETADEIGKLVQKRGKPFELLAELSCSSSPLLQHGGASTALEELGVLFKYLKAAKCVDRIVFDLSLARGLDYYTGVIYEAVFKGSTQVGSIAAGGRYDNLVGMFSGKQVPAVGVSLGIERVFAIMEQQQLEGKTGITSNQVEVWVVVLDTSTEGTEQAIEIVTELWEARIKAEFKCVKVAKLKQQIGVALAAGIPWLVIAGENEFRAGIVHLKNIAANLEEDIRREDLVTELRRRLGTTVSNLPPHVA